MYKIITCTGRTIEEHIPNLETALRHKRKLEQDMKSIGSYYHWYYQVEKEDE